MKKAIALRRLSPLSSCTKSPRYFLLRGRIEEGEACRRRFLWPQIVGKGRMWSEDFHHTGHPECY